MTSAAMDAAYVRLYHIYTAEEMIRFERDEIKPRWPQGKEEHFFVAILDHHPVGVADLVLLSDGWRTVEPPPLRGLSDRQETVELVQIDSHSRRLTGHSVWSLESDATQRE